MILYIITHKSNIINIINLRFKKNFIINTNSAKTNFVINLYTT